MLAPRLSVGKIFLLSVAFTAVFAGTYFSVKNGASATPLGNGTTEKIFVQYGYAAAPALAILFFLAALVGIGLKNLVGLKRFVSGNAFVVLAAASAFAWFGWFLVFKEPRNTEVGRAIIDFWGRPLLYASGFSAAVALVFTVLALALKVADSQSVSKSE